MHCHNIEMHWQVVVFVKSGTFWKLQSEVREQATDNCSIEHSVNILPA